MAERRAINSNIWDDEVFGQWQPTTMLVWFGLISRMTDDQGRLTDNPSMIRSRLFPYQDVQVDAIREAIEEIGDRLIRYEVQGKRYIQIRNWWQHQPMQYATPSNYPAPVGWEDRIRTNYKKNVIVYNWPGQANSEVGCLLVEAIRNLPIKPSWTSYLGNLPRVSKQQPYVDALNSNFNPNSGNELIDGGLTAATPPQPPSNFPADPNYHPDPDEVPTGIYAPYERVFVEETGIAPLAGGPQSWFTGLSRIVESGATPEDFRQAIREQQAAGKRTGKNYNGGSPGSYHTACLNVIARRNAKPPESNAGLSKLAQLAARGIKPAGSSAQA